MGFSTNDASALSPGLDRRIRQGVLAYAQTVAAEASNVTNHGIRVAYAGTVTRGLTEYHLTAWVQAVVADGVTTMANTDGELTSRISALWNLFAGAL